MFETKKTKELKNKIFELEKDLEDERKKVKQREEYIDALKNNNIEIGRNRDDLKKQKELFESRTVIAETKLGRVRNAIVANPDDNEKAYKEIYNIILGKNGKHAK